MAASTEVNAMGKRVGETVGFDPITIITIIQTIISLLQGCKKPANKQAAASMIDSEFLTLAGRKRADKCPMQFRKVFRENGITSKEDMNDCWEAMVFDARANSAAVSAALVA